MCPKKNAILLTMCRLLALKVDVVRKRDCERPRTKGFAEETV